MNLSYLLILVCPISMGLMMWLMMRGGRQQQPSLPHEPVAQPELAGLQQQLRTLEEQQATLLRQIERVSASRADVGQMAEPEPANGPRPGG